MNNDDIVEQAKAHVQDALRITQEQGKEAASQLRRPPALRRQKIKRRRRRRIRRHPRRHQQTPLTLSR